MEYQALYRKWRPLVFDDVVGQEHVTRTIKNEVRTNQMGHAFLFCGSRGTGKTSTARILSRAINCEQPKDGNPCNSCATCKGILDGSIMDIVEIDAASNSGVDNIRSLREEANYGAAFTKYKVYIIDEVHALSRDAFAALLKLLEEPPEHVKFVLATTEANKVLDTISSRCQRFDFKRITPKDIFERLDRICDAEGIMIEEKALRMLASAADGSLRDALSLLDPCIAAGREVDTAFVADFLGQADHGAVIALCEAVGRNDVPGVLACIEAVCERGRNLPPFMETVIRAMRDMMIVTITETVQSEFSEEDAAKLVEAAKLFSTEKLLYAIKTLSESISTARFMTNPRVVFESALIKLCIENNDGSVDALLARVGELERKIESGVVAVKPQTQKNPQPQPEEEEIPPDAPDAFAPSAFAPQSEFVESVKDKWPELVNALLQEGRLSLYTTLENASLREWNGKLAVTFPPKSFQEFRAMLGDHLETLRTMVREYCGVDVDVVVKSEAEFDAVRQSPAEDPFQSLMQLPYVEKE